MSAPLKKGDICIWQNCTGPFAYLNGEETTITGGLARGFDVLNGGTAYGYRTDTPDPFFSGFFLLGEPHELRRKEPPTTGEEKIRSMFKPQPDLVVS